MASNIKSDDPADYLGVFKRLSDVHPEDRLGRFESAYKDRDVWEEWLQATGREGNYDHERAGRYWREHMDGRGRHHALADPDDVEAYFSDLLADMSVNTVYAYFYRTRRFYQWLVHHTEHPHQYNPVHIAADRGGETRTVWDFWVSRRDSA